MNSEANRQFVGSFRRAKFAAFFISLAIVHPLPAQAALMPQVEWTRYSNTSDSEYGYSVTTDAAGSAYISGETAATPGAFLVKYSATGELVWQRQWGDKYINPQRLAADGLGNIYIAGQYVPLSQSRSYAFLAKYNDAGDFQWMQQLSLADTSDGMSVSADKLGNVFIGGRLADKLPDDKFDYDGFVGKYDALGNQQWIARVDSPQYDEVAGVAADQLGNAYFTGTTEGSLFATPNPSNQPQDVIVGKLDATGNLAWGRQFGTEALDTGAAISVAPGGKIYVSGNTEGDLAGDNTPYDFDPFLRKYDVLGNEIWTRQLSLDSDLAFGLATDESGNAFLGGFQYQHPANADYHKDALVAKYDDLGNLNWTTTFGTSVNDEVWSVSVQPTYGIYVGGYSWDSYSPYTSHAFVSRLTETPEPSTLALLCISALAAVVVRKK